MRRAVVLSVLSFAMLGAGVARKPLPDLPADLKQELIGYLKAHWQSPEDYIIGKFKDHEIVFVGEHHRIKHDAQLIGDLIPRLYAAGVHNLGIEFGCHEYQDTVDHLLNAPIYDEALARWLIFKMAPYWGFVEYEDLYRKAWELNRSLPSEARKFRVVNLDYRIRWDLAKENMTPADSHQVFFMGDRDTGMARIVLEEFVRKGQEALIYSGSHHAFTRYRQPRPLDPKTGEFSGFRGPRMGNIVRDSIPDRVFCVMLHQPWMQKADLNAMAYPVGGVIDVVMRAFTDKRVGFDILGSPFGRLTDTSAYYTLGYEPFRLDAYCDGYVFQKPFSEYEGCGVDTLFVTDVNFKEAVDFIPNVAARKYLSKPVDFVRSARDDTNFKRRFEEFQ